MPRRSIFTDSEKQDLVKIPTETFEMCKHYLLSEPDISIISQKRGAHNKVGFALLLCLMRYPGISMNSDTVIPSSTFQFIVNQLSIKDSSNWCKYFKREQTRREHLVELQNLFKFQQFGNIHYENMLQILLPLAKQTDSGITIANALIDELRKLLIIIPSVAVIEKLCAEAITLGTQSFYNDLLLPLTDHHKLSLDELLKLKANSKISHLHWILQPATIPKTKYMLLHIERLTFIKNINLPMNLGKNIHQNRLNKLACEGRNLFARHIQGFESNRKYATLVAVVIDTKSSIIDEIIALNDKILGSIFNKARNKHNEEFHNSSKSINEKLNLYAKIGQALIEAKQSNANPFIAIEAIIPWEDFTNTVQDTQDLAKPNNFDFLYRITKHYSMIRKYIVNFIEALEFKAYSHNNSILKALEIIQTMHKNSSRKIPDVVPTGFISNRWQNLVFKEDGSIDRQFYDFVVLSELKNSLRSGDVWVVGSRQYKDFKEYLLDDETLQKLKINSPLPIQHFADSNLFIQNRIDLLNMLLDEVHTLANNEELEDAVINDDGLRITPLTNSVPEDINEFSQKVYSLLPKIKITNLLQEVDDLVDYTQHFVHLKNDKKVENNAQLLTVILADAINLGLTKMAEACPGTSYSKLSSIQAWYIRDETYKQATAAVVNYQHEQEITKFWGEGNSSSSDGQNFKAGGRNTRAASVNPKYGNDPGVTYYSHTSDRYAPFYINVITSNLRDSTYVLDGLLNHDADLNIYEHYTDTAGFTDHVFALMPLLGFKFAPRIRDLKDKRIYLPTKSKSYPKLTSLIGGTINIKLIEQNWEEIIRLALSIKHGTVTSSLILRKLSNYPRQNNLALALRELGKLERSIFMLEWIKDPQLRRRVQAGLNKGEAKHALTRAVHFNRLGEIRDRTIENQRQRASGLNLVVGAIILWNTVYIQKAIKHLRKTDSDFNEDLIKHLSPLGWEHINLTGDYIWSTKLKASMLRVN